jgi:phosphatidylglycerophosphate synthase
MEIRRAHQPKEEPPAWRWARTPSAYVTWLLFPTSISADAVSWFHLVLLLLAATAMAVGTWPAAVAASLTIVLSYVADNVDGELARARNATSARGKWIERTAHHYGERALILGAGLGGHAKGYEAWWLVAPLAVVIFEIYVRLLRLNNARSRNRVQVAAPGARADSRGNLARWLLGSGWVFYLRPVSTNLWIVTGVFGVIYETLLVVTVLRIAGTLGFLASHALLLLRGSPGDPLQSGAPAERTAQKSPRSSPTRKPTARSSG